MVNPVGAFAKPTSLSIPIRTIRSRSPSVNELSRSISTERPRTPRPLSSSRGSTVVRLNLPINSLVIIFLICRDPLNLFVPFLKNFRLALPLKIMGYWI